MPLDLCPYFEKEGVCREGVDCKFHHDYQKPITSNQLRVYFDTIVSDLNLIRDDIQELKNGQESLIGASGELHQKVNKIKKTDQEVSALTSTVSELVEKLKEAGISQLHFSLQPEIPPTPGTSSSLVSRTHDYLKQNKFSGKRNRGQNPKKK